MNKGQISVEHIVLLGVVLIILVPGVYIFYNSTIKMNEDFEEIRIKSAGEDIVDTVSTVGVLGDLTKKTVLLDLPESFKNITVIGNSTLVITYENSKGISQMVFISQRPLRGSTMGYSLQDIQPGRTKLAVQNFQGYVCLTQQGGTCLASCGNRILETEFNETCDGLDVGGLSCVDLGFNGGVLTCNYDCSQILTDLCTGCPTTGSICLDQNLVTSGPNYLKSRFVIEPLGETAGGAGNEITTSATTSYESYSCAYNGFYSAVNGGGVRIDTTNLNLTTGLNTISTTLYRDPSATNAHFAIQCDGTVIDIPQGSNNINLVSAECMFDSQNPDIRFLSHGSDRVNFDNFAISNQCDPSICIPPHDSGYVCLSEGNSISGGEIESDYVNNFDSGFGEEGDFTTWTQLKQTNGMNLGEYEMSCDIIYYAAPANAPQGQMHEADWKIRGSEFGNMISGPGDYTLFLNVIFGNQSLPSSFTIKCGNEPRIPLVSNSPFQRSYHFMETLKIDCSFDGDSGDEIEIESLNHNSKSLYIEQFRLVKKC